MNILDPTAEGNDRPLSQRLPKIHLPSWVIPLVAEIQEMSPKLDQSLRRLRDGDPTLTELR